MTERLSPKLTAEEEAGRIIVADIRAYPQGGDKREEHLRLYGDLLPPEEIEALWAERYAEIAKPKVVGFRRFAKREQSSANSAESFSVPATQPAADKKPKVTTKTTKAAGIVRRYLDSTEPEAKEPDQKNKEAALEVLPKAEGQLVPFVAPKPQAESIGQTEPGTYTPREIIDLNKKHAVISNLGGKCVIMEFVPSCVAPGTSEPSYQTFGTFRERYLNRYINDDAGAKPTSLGKYWLNHPRRRQYEGLDLVANGPVVLPGNIFNLWRGWGVEAKEGDWSLLRKHVHEVLANGDSKFADYIIHWTAWVLQHPGDRPEAALTLRGGKGSGKGVWGDVLMKIFGEHGLQIFDPTHLTGKHNLHLQNKLFLFADEAFWAGDRTAERTLKGLVTEKRMMIEPKGVNAFPWPNRLAIFMAANADWVVPAGADERRYAVGNVNERWKQNEDYFTPLLAEIDNGSPAAMLWDLQKMDLGKWHPRMIPQTKALLEQKMLSLEGLEQWWVSMLDAGELPFPSHYNNPRRVYSDTLLDAAQGFSPRTKYINATELGNFLGKMGCEHRSAGNKWTWIFPPLADAREAWRKRAGGHWEWLEPDLEDWLGELKKRDRGT